MTLDQVIQLVANLISAVVAISAMVVAIRARKQTEKARTQIENTVKGIRSLPVSEGPIEDCPPTRPSRVL